MIAIRNVNIWAEHVVIADLDAPASIDHDVTVEIISIANYDSDSLVVSVLRPQPAALREGIKITNLNLAHATASSATLDTISNTDFHPKSSVRRKTNPAGHTTWDSQQPWFNMRQGPFHFKFRRALR
jgi:hypothetical protein